MKFSYYSCLYIYIIFYIFLTVVVDITEVNAFQEQKQEIQPRVLS